MAPHAARLSEMFIPRQTLPCAKDAVNARVRVSVAPSVVKPMNCKSFDIGCFELTCLSAVGFYSFTRHTYQQLITASCIILLKFIVYEI